MPASQCIEELSIDPYPITGALNASFKDVSHAEVLGDLRDLHRLALVDKCRVPSDDEQARNLREVGDQIIGHAVCKMLLAVRRHVGEWQHRNRWLVRQGE